MLIMLARQSGKWLGWLQWLKKERQQNRNDMLHNERSMNIGGV